MIKRLTAAFIFAILVAPIPASADTVYYLYRTVTYYQPYSSTKDLVAGPFDTLSDCQQTKNAAPVNYIQGGGEYYSCEARTTYNTPKRS
jgi:hypothetical protein